MLGWIAVLANALGLFTGVATLFRLHLERAHGPGRPDRLRRCGAMLLLTGATTVAVCGQYLHLRLAREPISEHEPQAVKDAARVRLALSNQTPLSSLHVRFASADPFQQEAGTGPKLRIAFADEVGNGYASELSRTELRPVESGDESLATYCFSWQDLVENNTTGNGSDLAGGMAWISDLVRLRDLTVELVTEVQLTPPQLPTSLWLGHVDGETVELFRGEVAWQEGTWPPWSARYEPQSPFRVVYRDSMTLEDRVVASSGVPSPVEYRVQFPVLGILLGSLLILTGLALRCVAPAAEVGWAGGRAAALLLAGLIAAVYWWLSTLGTFTEWMPRSTGVSMLAEAFLHGQLHLVDGPPQELLAQPNPYAYAARETQYANDSSLYNGRYYLYWGPTPALLLALPMLLFGLAEVPDSFLVFLFSVGLVLFGTLLLREVWRRKYPRLPWPTAFPGILALGLAAPLPCLLSVGSIYEVFGPGGQCFLVGGIYWAFSAFRTEKPAWWRLLLAGVFWAAAATTRISLVLAVGFLAAAVAWQVLRSGSGSRFRRQTILALTCHLLPLAAGAAAMGAYNYVRFGSPFETGNRYVLTPKMNTLQLYEEHKFFNVQSFLPNLYSYFLFPPSGREQFPYLNGSWIPLPSWLPVPDWYYQPTPPGPVPDLYFTPVPVVGLVYSAPFLWYGLVAILAYLRLPRQGSRPEVREVPPPDTAGASSGWLVLCLLGAAVFGAFPAIFMPAAILRYQLDATPLLLILAMLGVWQGADALSRRPLARQAWLILAAFLATFTAASGVLYGVAWGMTEFLTAEPCLIESLAQAFPRLSPAVFLISLSLVLLLPFLPFLLTPPAASLDACG